MRKCKGGILQELCKRCESTEIPSIFALWTGIAVISAALGREVFIDQGHFTVFPNMYIVLVAGSAKCRKSSAIGMALDLLAKVKPPIKMLSQKMTPEALIEDLSGVSTSETQIIQSAVGTIIVDELATFIDAKAFQSGMIALLTKLYDGRNFEYRTRSHGCESVESPCVSILGGSTVHWIKEAVPEVAIGGGFTSRVVFILQENIERLVPWSFRSEDDVKKEENIVHDLNEMRKMHGPFGFNDEAKEAYAKEYMTFIKNSQLFSDRNLAGYSGRRHVTLMKLAMIISASYSDTRLVKAEDITSAISILSQTEKLMPKVLSAIASSVAGSLQEEVLKFLSLQKTVSRAKLIKTFRYKLTSRELEVVIEGLLESKAISHEVLNGEVIYTFITMS